MDDRCDRYEKKVKLERCEMWSMCQEGERT